MSANKDLRIGLQRLEVFCNTRAVIYEKEQVRCKKEQLMDEQFS